MRYEDQHLFQEAINYYINAEDAISLAISFESNLSIKEILACFAKTLNSRIENLKCKVSMKLKGNKEQYQPIRYCSSPKRMKLNASHESNESIGDSVEHINTFNPDKFNDFNYRPIKYPKNEDVIGLEDAKKVLMEAIVLPRRFPELFKACKYRIYKLLTIIIIKSSISFQKAMVKDIIIWCMFVLIHLIFN